MSANAVAIIGMGPRGLTVLERLVSIGRRFPRLSLVIDVIEPGPMGCGVHRPHQPDYLLLNTVCGLPTMFPPRRHATDIEGESFFAWAQRQAYVKCESRKNAMTSDDGLSRSSYLPRALFGAYLQDCFARIVRQRPANVDIIQHACNAVALWRDGDAECIECSDGSQIRSQFVVLTTGHTGNRPPRGDLSSDPYGFLQGLSESDLDANDSIGLAGFGLSSFDVLAGLTLGRDGAFFEDGNGRLRYKKSGREPRIHMFSRSGVPYFARPYRDYGTFSYDPVIFDVDRIRSIRSANGGRGLHFQSMLLPLLHTELRAASCRRKLASAGRPLSDADWDRLRASDQNRIETWVKETERSVGAVDVAALLAAPDVALGSGAAYQRAFVDLIEADLRQATLGLNGSMAKHLAEVLLHLRRSLNAAVDFGGLDEQSHDIFFGSFAGMVRRLAIGPQPERSEELVALIRAGVVRVDLGPNPVIERRPDGAFEIASRRLARSSSCVVSHVIKAQSPFPSLERSESPLLIHLFRSGRVRKHRDNVQFGGGVDIDRLHHPVGRSGQIEDSLFVLGPLCEGSIYYNTYVPTTIGWSQPFIEAEVVADQIVRHIRGGARAPLPRSREHVGEGRGIWS